MISLLYSALGIRRKDFIIVRVIFLLLIYVFLLSFSKWAFLPFALAMGFTFFAYSREKSLTNYDTETFEDDNLFFRYGISISSNVYPFQLKGSWYNDDITQIIQELSDDIAAKTKQDIDGRILNGTHTSETITISDSKRRSDSRRFLKFAYTGLRNGKVTNFLNFSFIGSYILIHFDSYTKGIPHWYDILDFFLMSPFNVWFWVIPWLRSDYSITTKTSRFLDNSFEEYDLKGYYFASQYSILDSIKSFLKEKDLLSPEMEMVITNQIINLGNMNLGGNQVVGGKNNSIVGSVGSIINRSIKI